MIDQLIEEEEEVFTMLIQDEEVVLVEAMDMVEASAVENPAY